MVKQSRVRHSFRRPGADTSGSSERRPIGGLLGHLVGARGLLGSSTTIKKPPPLPPAAESASAAQAAAEKATAAENAKGRHQRKKARRYLKRKAEWEASRNAPAANSARSPAARGAAGQDRAAVPAADSSPSPAAKGAAGRDRAALGETVQGGTVPDSADVPFALRSVPTKAERRKAIKKRKKAEARGEVYVPPVSVAVAEDGPASKRARTSARTDASNASNASSASDGRASQTSTGERVLKMGVRIQELLAGAGSAVQERAKVKIAYVGRLGGPAGPVFDKASGFSFRVGRGEVIKGFDIGLAGMRRGGKRRITVPPAAGYGGQKAGTIPPHSTLVFDITML